MLQEQRELIISRIISGYIRLHIDDTLFLFFHPNKNILYRANEIYIESLTKAKSEGLYSDEEMIDFLIGKGLWSIQDEENIEKRKTEIENFKVELYNCAFNSTKRQTYRKYLKIAKDNLNSLLERRNSYVSQTQSGYASISKLRFILINGLRYKNKKMVFTSKNINTSLLDKAFGIYTKNRLGETQYRELARTEPWYHIWLAGKKGKLFDRPSTDYTEEQINLVSWSIQYDNIREHPESPSESILADDDILDGWIILQGQKQKKIELQKDADSLIRNDKIRNADEICIVAGTREDAKKIDDLNTTHNKAIKRSRLKHLQKHGIVHEGNMPDSKQEISKELHRLQKEKLGIK